MLFNETSKTNKNKNTIHKADKYNEKYAREIQEDSLFDALKTNKIKNSSNQATALNEAKTGGNQDKENIVEESNKKS
jgi:hypothetical protein